MSFWDVHFLSGVVFGLVYLIGTTYLFGSWTFRTQSTFQVSRAGRFILWLGLFVGLSLVHLWLDAWNPRLWI